MTACKASDDSDLEAFEESALFSSKDRIYLTVDDYSIFKTPNPPDPIKLLLEMKKREFATTKIATKSHLKAKVEETHRHLEMGMILSGNFSVIACFNESRSSTKCVPLPDNSIKRLVQGKEFSKVHRQSKSTCRAKGKPGIRLNERFRASDFAILDVKDFASVEALRDSQRDGACYKLFSDEVLIDSMAQYDRIAQKLEPGFADYLRTGVSGVGCMIGVGNIVNLIKTRNVVLTPGSVLYRMKNVINSSRFLGRTWSVSIRFLSAFGRVDDVLIKLLTKTKGTTRSPIVQKYLGVATAKIFSKMKGLGMLGAVGALKVSPRLTRLIGLNFFQANDDEFEPVRGKPVQYTVDETERRLQEYANQNQDVANNIDRVVDSDVYKSAIGSLEKYGFETKDLAYMALSVGAVFVPGLSCALLAADVKEVVDQKRSANNLKGLRKAINQARADSVQNLKRISDPGFNELSNLYDVYSELNSAESVAQDVRSGREGSNGDKNYSKLGEYYRNLNYYIAQRFNKVVAEDKFKHTGYFSTTSAFEGIIDAEATSKQRIDERFQALIRAKTAEIEILNQLREIKEEEIPSVDLANEDLAVIFEESQDPESEDPELDLEAE